VLGTVAVPRPAARFALDVSPVVPIPGTAAWPALAVTAAGWPCPFAVPLAAVLPFAVLPFAVLPFAVLPFAVLPFAVPPGAGLVAPSNSPLLTKPATPWAPSGPVNVCALTERLGLESPPIVLSAPPE
jgi:hypothetical protein